MKPVRLFPCAALLLAVACQPAHAASDDASGKPPPLVGEWTIARTTEWPDVCTLRLQKDRTIGGWAVKLGRGCKKSFEWTGDLFAWYLAKPGELVLQDAERHAVIRFHRDEAGDWVGTGPDTQDYVIQRGH